jgi:integrase
MPRKNRKIITMETVYDLPKKPVYCGDGLVLEIRPNRSFATNYRWKFRYKKPADGKWTETVIGSVHTMEQEVAWARIARMKRQLALGEDPVVTERTHRLNLRAKATTFAKVATEWLELPHEWRGAKTRKQVERMLFKHGSTLCVLPVGAITPKMISEALKPLISEKHHAQARRTLGVWQQVFKFAKAHGYCTGDNPAQTHRDQLPKRKGEGKNHPALPYAEVPNFVRELRKLQGDSVPAIALEFCILTATRTNETLGTQWSEFENGIWTVPGSRTKTGKPHRVPLSDRATEILRLRFTVVTPTPAVFTGSHDKPLGENGPRQSR